MDLTPMTYKKHGGLHFVRLGRFGFSFFLSAKRPANSGRKRTPRARKPIEWAGAANLERLRGEARPIYTDHFRR
jgi:hypothetical protein